MAVSYIEIDTDRLRADAGELEENTAKARDSLEGMMAELEELNAMWKGRANQAFQTQTEKDRGIMEKLLKEMDSLASCMEHAAREYDRCENEVKGSVDSINI